MSLLPLMPEWYLAITLLAILSLLGLTWHPLLMTAPLVVLAMAAPIVQAVVSASRARFANVSNSRLRRVGLYSMVALLHVVQPLARLRGRLRHGLTIWRQRGATAAAIPIARTFPLVVTRYRPPQDWLRAMQLAMKDFGAVVLHGGDYDCWDLEVRRGIFGSSRLLMAFEDTGSGTQLVRVRAWPRCDPAVSLMLGLLVGATVAATFDAATGTAFGLALGAMFVAWRIVEDCGITMGTIRRGLTTVGLTQPMVTSPALRAPEPHAPPSPRVMPQQAAVAPDVLFSRLPARATAAKAALPSASDRARIRQQTDRLDGHPVDVRGAHGEPAS